MTYEPEQVRDLGFDLDTPSGVAAYQLEVMRCVVVGWRNQDDLWVQLPEKMCVAWEETLKNSIDLLMEK